MDNQEFQEWLARFELMDSDQMEQFFRHVACIFRLNEDEIRNMDVVRLSVLFVEAANIVKNRTGN